MYCSHNIVRAPPPSLQFLLFLAKEGSYIDSKNLFFSFIRNLIMSQPMFLRIVLNYLNILLCRNTYRKYKSMYKEHLHRPTDSELKMDLQLLEDSLDVTSILAAREQAKMEVCNYTLQGIKSISNEIFSSFCTVTIS